MTSTAGPLKWCLPSEKAIREYPNQAIRQQQEYALDTGPRA